jgi:hypothetical protein
VSARNDGSDVVGYIATFADIADNWDSYGAKATTAEAIAAAQHFARSVRAVPSNDGGVLVEFENESIMVSIGPDGRLKGFLVDTEDLANQIAARLVPVPAGGQGTDDG